MGRYKAVRHKLIDWTNKYMFELGAAQILVGVVLIAAAYLFRTGEPPIILWMSGLALVFSGATTIAVAAK